MVIRDRVSDILLQIFSKRIFLESKEEAGACGCLGVYTHLCVHLFMHCTYAHT